MGRRRKAKVRRQMKLERLLVVLEAFHLIAIAFGAGHIETPGNLLEQFPTRFFHRLSEGCPWFIQQRISRRVFFTRQPGHQQPTRNKQHGNDSAPALESTPA